jgi:hypothetical protein
MSKRGRDEDVMMDEPLGPRSAKRKAIEVMSVDKAKQDVAAEKRQVNKQLRAEVDDLAGMFGKMNASSAEPAAAMDMEGQGRRRRRRKTRKHKKSKKSKKTRKH